MSLKNLLILAAVAFVGYRIWYYYNGISKGKTPTA